MIGASSTEAASATRDPADGLSLPRTRACDPSTKGKTWSAADWSFLGADIVINVDISSDKINFSFWFTGGRELYFPRSAVASLAKYVRIMSPARFTLSFGTSSMVTMPGGVRSEHAAFETAKIARVLFARWGTRVVRALLSGA